MRAEGHIINHSYHHPDMSQMGKRRVSEGAGAAGRLVRADNRRKDVEVLPPAQGKYSDNNLQLAKELGYRTIFWSLAYVDWKQEEQPTREEAMSKLKKEFIRGRLYCCTIRPGRTEKFWMRF